MKELVDELNRRGITVRGRRITTVQVSDLQERSVISVEEWTHPGRPSGGSSTRYEESTLATVEAVAKGLNEKRDTARAVLVALVDDKARIHDVRETYKPYLRRLNDAVERLSTSEKRLRLPSGVLRGRLDSLAKGALLAFANGTEPVPGAWDALFSVLGLPDDLRTAPREPSAVHYPSLEELLSSVGIPHLMRKVRNVEPAQLEWAARSMHVFLRYLVVMYRVTSMTGSSGPQISSDDPRVVASAQHVNRTLMAGGWLLDRLMARSDLRTEMEMAALSAPLLLVLLDRMGKDARDTYRSLMDQVSQNLPGLRAMESLISDVPVEHRRLLSWESLARLPLVRPDELVELRAIARVWAERNPDMVALLVTQPAIERKEKGG